MHVAFQGGHFMKKTTPDVEAVKFRLLLTAQGFLALMEGLVAAITEDV